MELTLGPILFEWKREDVLDFYKRVADMPFTKVYLGEVVCVKKRGLTIEDMNDIGKMLEKKGKTVIISTLAIASNEEELTLTREMVNLPFAVEANDMSVFNMCEGDKKDIYCGPHITTYNNESIKLFEDLHVKGITLPVELSRDHFKLSSEASPIKTEVFGHGKVPLAFSWRCYTSRAFGHSKTDCHHDCVRYEDGMDIKTVDGEPIFNINGTSILSAKTFTLVEYIEDLKDAGVSAIRISPQFKDMEKIVEVFRKRINGELNAEQGKLELESTSSVGLCNGWYVNGAGKDYIEAKDFFNN